MREFFFENNLKLFLSPQLNYTQLSKYERSSECFWEGVGLALEEMRRDKASTHLAAGVILQEVFQMAHFLEKKNGGIIDRQPYLC